jgi:hypothetical protein
MGCIFQSVSSPEEAPQKKGSQGILARFERAKRAWKIFLAFFGGPKASSSHIVNVSQFHTLWQKDGTFHKHSKVISQNIQDIAEFCNFFFGTSFPRKKKRSNFFTNFFFKESMPKNILLSKMASLFKKVFLKSFHFQTNLKFMSERSEREKFFWPFLGAIASSSHIVKGLAILHTLTKGWNFSQTFRRNLENWSRYRRILQLFFSDRPSRKKKEVQLFY